MPPLFPHKIIREPQHFLPVSVVGGQIKFDEPFSFLLNRLRLHNHEGIGYLAKLKLKVKLTYTSVDNDPAVPGYLFAKFVDTMLEGGDHYVDSKRQGYHHALRKYQRDGQFSGLTAPDQGADDAGSHTRTFDIVIDFDEPNLGPHRFFRMKPCTWYRSGEIQLVVHEELTLNGADVTLTDCEITPTVEIIDFPLSAIPIPTFVNETFKPNRGKDSRPSPGSGKFLRLLAALDPSTATFSDDLSTVETIEFGTDGGSGMIIPKNTDVIHWVQQWNERYSADPKIFSTLTGQQEYLRFLDPTANASGKLHAIPLVHPLRGHSIKDAPSWGVSAPEVFINRDDRSGTPEAYDFIADEVSGRDAKGADNLKLMLEGMFSGAYARYQRNGAVQLVEGVPFDESPLITRLT
jgi:hypothetical protein